MSTAVARQGAKPIEYTATIAELVSSTRATDFSPELVAYTKVLALSAIGAMIAGSRLPTGRMLTSYVSRLGGTEEATVAGVGLRTSVEAAAFANGTFVHATEYEDGTYPEAVSAGTLFPAIIALAEKLGVSGERVIEAFIVGYEVQSRLARDCRKAVPRGYLTLSLCGVLGVAAAASKLLGLNAAQTRTALSLAASQGSGLTRQIGTMAHYFEMGMAGRDGIAAAFLAAEGLTASGTIFEGALGFCDLVTGGEVSTPEDTVSNWGKPFRAMDIVIKNYPCCSQVQRLIDGVYDLKNEEKIQAADVESISVEANRTIRNSMKHPEPFNGDQARFSIPHCMAVTLIDDEISLKSFSDESVKDQSYRAMWKRVKIVARDDWDWGPGGPIPVTVKLKDGRTFHKDCAAPDGPLPIPELMDRISRRHRVCVEDIVGKEKTNISVKLVKDLDHLDDARRLTATIA